MLLLATRNRFKLKEFKSILKSSSIKLIGLNQLTSIPSNFDIPETGKTFQENAVLKAEGFGQKANLLTLADDTGLCIDYLNGEPGIFSARFADRHFAKARQKIIRLLKSVPRSKRTAQFVCTLALYNPQSGKTSTFTGKAHGYITNKEIGSRGFHYDSIFYSKDLKQTYAQASFNLKNKFSHRAKAIQKLLRFLSQLNYCQTK